MKVILIGDRDLYEMLYEYEEDFRKIFKVRVEFDEEMPMSDTVIEEYAGRLRGLSEKENLFPFDRGAFASILEYGVRRAGRRNKVTARFVDIADLAREAHYAAAGWAKTLCAPPMCAQRLPRRPSGTISSRPASAKWWKMECCWSMLPVPVSDR